MGTDERPKGGETPRERKRGRLGRWLLWTKIRDEADESVSHPLENACLTLRDDPYTGWLCATVLGLMTYGHIAAL